MDLPDFRESYDECCEEHCPDRGSLARNIFWQVAGIVSIGTTAHFEGIILSITGITFQRGAKMNGRALAQTAVILDHNAITKPQ